MRNYKDSEDAAEGMRVVFNLKWEVNNRTGADEMHAVDIISETSGS
jgi:hypothetical protein